MSKDIAFALAEHASSLDIKNMSAKAVTATKLNIYDTLATTIAGSSAPGIKEMLSLIKEWGGSLQATVRVFGGKFPAHNVAWINAAMAHARDYDETHDRAMLHTGVVVIPAVMAAAEMVGGVSGNDVLAGIAAGLDIHCRLGISTTVGIVESGWVYTSLLGIFGAAAAVGRVMGLNSDEIINAMGIAYSQASGNYQTITDSALTKRMQPGFAAQAALVSAQMAKKGIRGCQNIFQGTNGFFRVYLNNQYEPSLITKDLGTRFEQENLSYKPYPCCRPNHPAINAAVEAKELWNLSPDEIARVEIKVNEHLYQCSCTPPDVRKAPKTIVDAQFSIPYTFAAAFINGRVGLADFTEEGIKREDVLALAAKVDGVVDEELERGWHATICPVTIKIETKEGKIYEHSIEHTLGGQEKPMSQTDFEAKMDDCIKFSALPMPDDTEQRIRSLINDLESLDNINDLVSAMCADPSC